MGGDQLTPRFLHDSPLDPPAFYSTAFGTTDVI